MASGAEGFVHLFLPGTGPLTLLALHGTGGDENNLVPLAQALAPGAAVLSPRGRVLEDGMARFFRRFAPNVLDEQDIQVRAAELAEWVERARGHHALAERPLVAVGFSNGANMAAALLLLHPQALAGAILLSPSAPFQKPPQVDLGGLPVFVGTGARDRMNRPGSAQALAEALRGRGAAVEVFQHEGGHEVTGDEVKAARAWLARNWGVK